MGGQSIVQWHRDNPGLGASKIDERVLDAILGENSDPVSLLESGAGKGIGQAVDLLACLGVGDRPVSHSCERGFGVFTDMEIQEIVKTHGPLSQYWNSGILTQ